MKQMVDKQKQLATWADNPLNMAGICSSIFFLGGVLSCKFCILLQILGFVQALSYRQVPHVSNISLYLTMFNPYRSVFSSYICLRKKNKSYMNFVARRQRPGAARTTGFKGSKTSNTFNIYCATASHFFSRITLHATIKEWVTQKHSRPKGITLAMKPLWWLTAHKNGCKLATIYWKQAIQNKRRPADLWELFKYRSLTMAW